jgi:hypothetical protein
MLTRYRMNVVCSTVPEAIARAGGMICDRSLTGWDVSVFATECRAEHDLALRMLGAARAESMPPDPAEQPLLRAVVVAGDLYRTNPDVRRWVEATMGEPRIEVLVWDTGRRAPNGAHVAVPVSRAAATFLDHALAIADCGAATRTSEFYRQLRTGRMGRPLRRQTGRTSVNGV